MSDTPTPDRRPFHEEAVGRLAAAAREALDAVPELDSVSGTLNWQVPLLAGPDLPPGFALGRRGELRGPGEVASALTQLQRLQLILFGRLDETLQRADAFSRRLAEEIQTYERRLDELRRRAGGGGGG